MHGYCFISTSINRAHKYNIVTETTSKKDCLRRENNTRGCKNKTLGVTGSHQFIRALNTDFGNIFDGEF